MMGDIDSEKWKNGDGGEVGEVVVRLGEKKGVKGVRYVVGKGVGV